jgi:sulfide dehydrogenase cytochrome subunit
MVARSLVFLFALGASALACAEDSNYIRLLASNCANCHGTDGRSQGGMPALTGLARQYIVLQLQEFKSGKRTATIMNQLSKGYSDADIDALAAYFSSLKN